jgi:hypothetical protein
MGSKVSIPPNIRSAVSDDGGTLLDLEKGVLYSLNSTGARIWDHLQKGLATASILEVIAREFSVPIKQVATDLHIFLRKLEARELLSLDLQERFPKTDPESDASKDQ